jgi:hypothetical protein
VVDLSDVRGAHEMGGMRGHGYWYANEWISTDVTVSLRHATPPEGRCLVNPPASHECGSSRRTIPGAWSTGCWPRFPS